MSLDLWSKVEKTNPAHTKQVNFGRKITAIDPYQQIKNATEQFGAVGDGWGWEVKQVQYLPTNEVCVLISMWHGASVSRFEQWGQASLYIDKAETKKDTDCMKKATTDGITKCLSMLGFNADIFLGKFDDNKYVQQVTQEFKSKEPKKEYTQTMFEDQKMDMVELIQKGERTPKIIIDNLEKSYIVSDSIKEKIKGIK